MSCEVHYAGCGKRVDQDCERPHDDHVRRPTHNAMSVTRACGIIPVSTVTAQGGRMGPPTCGMGGTPGVTIGQTCISPRRAAGNPMLQEYFTDGGAGQVGGCLTGLGECMVGQVVNLRADWLSAQLARLTIGPQLTKLPHLAPDGNRSSALRVSRSMAARCKLPSTTSV